MMSRHFCLNSELNGAIAKRPPHAKNQLYVPDSFFNQFVTDIYTYILYVYIYREINRVLIIRMFNPAVSFLHISNGSEVCIICCRKNTLKYCVTSTPKI